MKITITKNQHDLVAKRNAAAQDLGRQAQAAQTISKAAAQSADTAAFALHDIVSCIALDGGFEVGEELQFNCGSEADGTYFIDLKESGKRTDSSAGAKE